jgi:hypothetical protein
VELFTALFTALETIVADVTPRSKRDARLGRGCHPRRLLMAHRKRSSGNGIIAESETSAITGDAISNGVWRFEIGKSPARLADKFHCHWVTRGLDGKLYAETLHERGGAWETAIYRLDDRGAVTTPIASGVDASHGIFLVDAAGAVVYQSGDRLVVDGPNGMTKPFRSAGTLAGGHGTLGSVKAMTWGADGALYASDGNRVLRAGPDGVLKEVAKLEEPVVEKLYAGDGGQAIAWGLAVDERGTIYAAVPAFGKTLKIGRDGKQAVVARSDNGWVAIGVAVSKGTVFLLESKTTARNNFGPRVRVVTAAGTSRLIGQINAD